MNVISGKSKILEKRILEEGNNSKADILFLADAGALYSAQNKNLFANIKSEIIRKKVPSTLRNDYWVGITKRSRILFYNPDLIFEDIYISDNFERESKKNQTIKLSKNLMEQVLNIKKFDFDIFKKAGLRIIGETKSSFYVQVANFRKDLSREIDLVEEYSRFIGYKNFQEILPQKALTYNSRRLENYKKIKDFFINYGFNEVFTNSLVNSNLKTNSFSLNLKNPLNKEINTLRTSMFPRLFEVMVLNLKS